MEKLDSSKKELIIHTQKKIRTERKCRDSRVGGKEEKRWDAGVRGRGRVKAGRGRRVEEEERARQRGKAGTDGRLGWGGERGRRMLGEKPG